ncbi:hypothetical protein [Haliangium ochraceum]|uniref:hypothetical protein n=1 Tax=Haliangium ochraceum TaxID=80816 RepID=UPI00019BAE4C|nr:hypothetical protein [Haliangium ochraceum]
MARVLKDFDAVWDLMTTENQTRATLVAELAAWEQRRNAERGTIQWMFTVAKAREKMGRSYPSPSL